MTPRISIVIPLFNSGPYIGKALNSIFAQTIQDFEIIIVDGGSTDNGIKIIETFEDDRITLICQHNKGVGGARNQGVNFAKADIIAFLDADDQWRPRFLETILKLLEKYPKAGFWATGMVVISNNKEVNRKYYTIPNNEYEGIIPNYFKTASIDEDFIQTSAVAINKAVFLDLSGFKEGASWGEDQDLWARIALKYPIAFSNKKCVIYNVSDYAGKLSRRVAITKEHPFIQTGTDFLLTKKNIGNEFDDLIKYICKLIINSSRYNLMIGNSEIKDILIKCTQKNYEMQKNFLLLWTLFPKSLYKKYGRYLFRFSIVFIGIIINVSRSIKNSFNKFHVFL
jgi:glycosyltransferase involved in cell wall biosynthesis